MHPSRVPPSANRGWAAASEGTPTTYGHMQAKFGYCVPMSADSESTMAKLVSVVRFWVFQGHVRCLSLGVPLPSLDVDRLTADIRWPPVYTLTCRRAPWWSLCITIFSWQCTNISLAWVYHGRRHGSHKKFWGNRFSKTMLPLSEQLDVLQALELINLAFFKTTVKKHFSLSSPAGKHLTFFQAPHGNFPRPSSWQMLTFFKPHRETFAVFKSAGKNVTCL